jgi:hypothetical protein
MTFNLISFKYLTNWPNIQTDIITSCTPISMKCTLFQYGKILERKPNRPRRTDQTLMLLTRSCTWKMSFECQNGHSISWRLSYFLQSLQPNVGKVHRTSFIPNYPVVLQCSRKIKKIRQTQHNLINGSLKCYMFRSAGNDHQTFHTKYSKHMSTCVFNVTK